MPSAGIAFVDRAAVLEQARQTARQMAERYPEIRRVILFGSFAHGQGRPKSDLDLVVIVGQTSLSPRERIAHYRPVTRRPIDLYVYSEAEVEQLAPAGSGVLAEALSRGVDLL